MMVLDRFTHALGAVVEDATDIVENIARRIPRYLPARLMQGRAEVIRCRGKTQSGAQCKRRPVADSPYCHQHRNQAKSDGRLLIIIDARDKAARVTSDISRKTWRATLGATSRLAAFSPRARSQVQSDEQSSGMRQFAGRIMEFLQAQKRWVTSAMVLLLVTAVPIAFLTLADGDLDSLAGFAREIIPRNQRSVQGDPNTLGRQQTPTGEPNAAGGFTLNGTRTPGTDFAGAYVSSVEQLSANNSMLQIFVPAGVEGSYQAVVTISEEVEYQCVILLQYSDRLYCIGPSLPSASQINLRIFRVDEVDGSQHLVFETNYTTGEFAPVATPSPVVPTYGGAFTWPDRFDKVEIRKEQQSSAMLAPLSTLLGIVLLLLYRVHGRREHRLVRRLVESPQLEPVH